MKISDHLTRIFDKIDYLEGSLRNIDKTLAKQSIILDEHVKRTNLLESEIKPVKAYVFESKNQAKAYKKLLYWLSFLLGIAVAIASLAQYGAIS